MVLLKVKDGKVPMVQGRSRYEIERLADRIVARFYQEVIQHPQPVPVETFLELVLPRVFKIDVGVQEDFPPGVEGAMEPRNRRGLPEIVLASHVYDQLYDGVPRARFTAAHESGHGILHARELQGRLLEATAPTLHREEETPRYRNPEWQANTFAGTLLMPTPAVKALVLLKGADPLHLAKTFNVSPDAARTRLHYLLKGGGLRT